MQKSALLLTLGFCFVGSLAHAEETLTVKVEGGGASPAVLQAMEKEAETALAPSGIHLIWKLGPGELGEVFSTPLAIIRLRGDCRPRPIRPRAVLDHPISEGQPLGQTHISDGQILPIADVLCDSIWDFTSRELTATSPNLRAELLGRAVGRVTAHELYHILLRTTSHAREGIARAEQTSADLLAPDKSFSEEDDRRMSLFTAESESGK